MRKYLCFIAISVFCFANFLVAQNPYELLGVKTEVLTLSKGKYNEFFDNDTIVQIGSVLFNTNTNEVVGFVEHDTAYSESTLKPEITSRWLSPDPLTNEFPSYSPYNYVFNNPIRLVDPDGCAPDDPMGPLNPFAMTQGMQTALNWFGKTVVAIVGSVLNPFDDGNAAGMATGQTKIDLTNLANQGILELGVGAAIGYGAGKIIKGVSPLLKTATKVETSSPYSVLKDSKTVGPGKDFTKSQKQQILEANKQANGGVLKSDKSGNVLDNPVQSKKGVPANMNQAEVDHVTAKSKGGANSYNNTQVLSKKENLDKGNK